MSYKNAMSEKVGCFIQIISVSVKICNDSYHKGKPGSQKSKFGKASVPSEVISQWNQEKPRPR